VILTAHFLATFRDQLIGHALAGRIRGREACSKALEDCLTSFQHEMIQAGPLGFSKAVNHRQFSLPPILLEMGAKMDGYPLKDLDLAALKEDLPAAGLERGDVGTVVFVYDQGKAYEVEFVAADGRTIAVETLRDDQLEPFTGSQILHARRLAEA